MKCLLLVILIIASCLDGKVAKKKQAINSVDYCFQYPKEIDSLKLNTFYDSARWFVYTWHCDTKYLPKSAEEIDKTFGELELKYDYFSIRGDSLEIMFNFFDGDRVIVPRMTRNFQQLSTGVIFDLETKKKLFMTSKNGYLEREGGDDNRFEHPLNKRVKQYLMENGSVINSCFRILAKKYFLPS